MNSGTTETIDDIYFLNEFVGYGVTSGSIIETIDGGFNWSVVHTFESTVWLDRSIVTTPDSVYCFAASINGDPFKLTKAHGESEFTQQAMEHLPKVPEYFNGDVYYIDWPEVYAHLYKYSQNTPVALATGAENFFVRDDFLSYATAWDIHLSNDHGDSWTDIQFHEPFLNSGPFQSFYNGSATMHAITQYPSILHTSYDAGETWQWMEFPNASSYYFRDPLRAIITGNQVISTNDGWHTWYAETLEHPVQYAYLHIQDITFLYGANGVIYRSSDPWLTLDVDHLESLKLVVRPNPAFHTLMIDLPSEIALFSAEIRDLQGRSIKTYYGSDPNLNIRDMTSGAYTLIASTSKGRLSAKIVIE